MTDRIQDKDRDVRRLAVTASDANVVVTAGAGTGKTSLIVDRILHLLTRRDHRLSLTNVVALTFTKKAAREMKIRLRRLLQLMSEIADGTHGGGRAREHEIQTIRTLQDDYAITNAELVKLSDEAMRDVERAHIGTIHSFAGRLLRLYPVEAGVDPSFQEDEGAHFHDHFEGEWKQWVERELSPSGPRRDVWRRILTRYSLDDVKQLAWSLADELLPVSSVSKALASEAGVNPHVESWLQGLSARGRSLQERYAGELVINQLLNAAVTLWEEVLAGRALQALPDAPVLQRKSVPSKKAKDWTEKDHEEAKGIIKIAQAIEKARSGLSLDVLQILNPFVVQCRTSFTANGFVSFNGLLTRARDLLRDHPHVRAEVKGQYQAILVDEFQDTDPVQYELILFLAEAAEQEAQEWRDVQPEPGKLFIVGDPKQSIYAFRRADIAAYDEVRDRLLKLAPRREPFVLRSNFRAHAQVLEPVNGCCAKLFLPIKGVQPPYEPLNPASEEPDPFPHERVQLRLVAPPPEDADGEEENTWKTDESSRAEAETLAQWLRNEVIDKERLLLDGQRVTIQPCHIAVLFRTLTHVRTYVEAFRRHDLRCLTEGERHFFERQEVINCVHVLRVLTNPQDRLAAVGVLRSPYGGCSDVEVEAIVRQGFMEPWEEASSLQRLPPVFSVFRSLRETVHVLPVSEAVNRIFEEVPLAELAAAARDGEQALANVDKLRDTILSMAGESGMTLREITRQLVRWADDPPDQAERPLIEEEGPPITTVGGGPQAHGDAIRLMSIHKAKGLEFPMVIVAGLHHDVDPRKEPVQASHDWLTDAVGLRLRDDVNLEGIFIESKLEERQRAERVRLLYVAMTRAQRRLVLSAGVPRKGTIRKGSLLSLLTQGWGLDVTSLIETETVDDVPADVTVLQARQVGRRHVQRPPSRLRPAPPDRSEHQRAWAAWMNRMKETRETPLFLSPKRVAHSPPDHVSGRVRPSPARRKGRTRKVPNDQGTSRVSPRKDHAGPMLPDRQAVVGTLAHRVLQDWDFSADPSAFAGRIEHCCQAYLTDKGDADVQSLCEELRDVFEHFVESEPYAVLREAEILGREVPFAVPWDRTRDQAGRVPDQTADSSCVMEGVIDVIYRRDRQIWLADYKTHHVDESSLDRVVQEHRTTVQVYQQGAAFALGGVPIRTQLIFLRSGRSVEV